MPCSRGSPTSRACTTPKAVRTLLLDRDGVINQDSPDYIRSPNHWRALPGALEAMARAQRAGFRLVVISNQSGLARGLFGIRELNAIHQRLCDELARFGGRVEAFFFCPHLPQDDCECRKPRAGLLVSLRERLGIDLTRTPFIGDRVSDVRAALSVGARPMLVRTGIDPINAEELASCGAVEVYDALPAAIAALV